MAPQAEANLALLLDVYARYQSGDVDFLFGLLSEDVRWPSVADTRALPAKNRRDGREGAAVHTMVRARSNTTGLAFEADKIELWTVRDGRIHSFREIFDTARALALMPPG